MRNTLLPMLCEDGCDGVLFDVACPFSLQLLAYAICFFFGDSVFMLEISVWVFGSTNFRVSSHLENVFCLKKLCGTFLDIVFLFMQIWCFLCLETIFLSMHDMLVIHVKIFYFASIVTTLINTCTCSAKYTIDIVLRCNYAKATWDGRFTEPHRNRNNILHNERNCRPISMTTMCTFTKCNRYLFIDVCQRVSSCVYSIVLTSRPLLSWRWAKMQILCT